LLALASEAERALAISAAVQLAVRVEKGAFDAARAPLALAALARADGEPALEAALLEWVERVEPAGVAVALDAALAGESAVPASWVAARARLPGGLGSESTRRLLADGSPARRAAAAHAAGLEQQAKLASLARNDPAPEVRKAALARLSALEGADALDTILAAFGDRDAALRGEAAALAAGLGAPAVPRLREVALGWPDPAPETAVLALRLCEAAPATQVLAELADGHPDARIRALAALALGRPLGHAD
jgi:HEAT repeat protein